jgi:2-dehydro-3-deoxyphosphogluconate aldolase/(4S)-4-hydroxy-2-oxoglutarate aldolase
MSDMPPSEVNEAATVNESLDRMLAGVKVIPVIVVEDLDSAVPMCRALVAGGLTILEVTLRSPVALEAIERIAAEVPDGIVGAGTVLSPSQVTRSIEAGAKFLVSPGATDLLLDGMSASGVPFLPGTATVSEVMRVLERGLTRVKFFPAEPAGGAKYLASLASPLPTARFCPTGGIDAAKAANYLKLPNVDCVGGSWMLPKDAVAAGDWDRIEALAREAASVSPA